jgi:hypothetical protein
LLSAGPSEVAELMMAALRALEAASVIFVAENGEGHTQPYATFVTIVALASFSQVALAISTG